MQSNTNMFVALWKFKGFRVFCGLVLTISIILGASFFITSKIISSDNINYPKVDHIHFRMQYIYHGAAENFADSRYQEPYEKNQCSGRITESPIHFHDNVDQIVHVHWKNITGGQVLKYYGLNKIGGLDNLLGFRWDEIRQNYRLTNINIYGKLLPQPTAEDKIYIYTGEKGNFTKRSVEDWTEQTLEVFFNKKSQLSAQFNILGSIEAQAQTLPKTGQVQQASNSNTVLDSLTENQSQPSEDELEQINNLLGNVVIFVQQDEPTEVEVANRFDMLQPLSLSTCGG
jgi:hypothetical protein